MHTLSDMLACLRAQGCSRQGCQRATADARAFSEMAREERAKQDALSGGPDPSTEATKVFLSRHSMFLIQK